MPRFLGIHTFPANAFTYDQVCQLGRAAQEDSVVKAYRSFISLSGGRAACLIDAPDQSAVVGWFAKMGMPTDAVVEVEVEGEQGIMHELHGATAGAAS